jgi:hypothetical protein
MVLLKIDLSRIEYGKIFSRYYHHCCNSFYHFNKKHQCYNNIFGGKKTSDYLRFFKYLLPKIYPIIVITINKINTIFISVLIPLPKMNILNKKIEINNAIYTIKTASINCSRVLIITGTIDKISQDKKHLFYFNFFGGFNN